MSEGVRGPRVSQLFAPVGPQYAVYSSLEHEVSLAVVGTIAMAFLAYLSKVYAT